MFFKVRSYASECRLWSDTTRPEHVSGAKNGAERAENRMDRSGARSGRGRKRWSGSGAWNGRSRSGERAESAAHSPLQPNSSLIS